MKQYTLTGGARIGMANATYPFANLKVDENKLELNASVVGNLAFSPKDIISIEPYQQFPIIGKGIKINHRVSNYNAKVIFWTFKNPQEVISEIQKTGFLDNINSTISADDKKILAKQKQGGFPIKKPFAIGAAVLWNILFVMDFYKFMTNPYDNIPIANGMTIAIGLLLMTALLTLVSESFRNLILKEGRELDDIKKFLYLIIGISSFMLFNLMLIKNSIS